MSEYIFEVLDRGKKSKLLVLQQEQVGPFIDYDKDHTQMIALMDGENKWICIKSSYSKLKNEVERDQFRYQRPV